MKPAMFEVEHRPGEGYILRFNPMAPDIFPEPARGHIRAARKEMLLAIRSLIDAHIESIDGPEKEKASTDRTTIEVQ